MRGPKNRGQFMRTLGEGLAEIHLAKPQHRCVCLTVARGRWHIRLLL
jgi:hypothetical protein